VESAASVMSHAVMSHSSFIELSSVFCTTQTSISTDAGCLPYALQHMPHVYRSIRQFHMHHSHDAPGVQRHGSSVTTDPLFLCCCCSLVLERPLMEAMCGAIGEVAQICVMYPLETIKVRSNSAHSSLQQRLGVSGVTCNCEVAGCSRGSANAHQQQ
jgi:hypothetical protein